MSAQAFKTARDFLLRHRSDHDTAYREFPGRRLIDSTGRSIGSTRNWRGATAPAGRR